VEAIVSEFAFVHATVGPRERAQTALCSAFELALIVATVEIDPLAGSVQLPIDPLAANCFGAVWAIHGALAMRLVFGVELASVKAAAAGKQQRAFEGRCASGVGCHWQSKQKTATGEVI